MKLKSYLNEQSDEEFGKYMQSLANVIGKGGILAHKGFSDYIKKTTGYEKEDRSFTPKEIMDFLEDINYHTEYAILNQLVKGNKKEADLLLLIAKEHQKLGHMPSDLSLLRTFISSDKKWFNEYWKTIGKDTYKGMSIRPDTMKIAKKMGKKGQEFLNMLMGDE
jgi:hypothetical protein